jgi:hypothetical protein
MSFAAVGAVAAVGTAAASAYSAYDQGQRAKKAASQTQGPDMYGRKVEPVPYRDRVGTDESFAEDIMPQALGDVKSTLPDIFRIAARVNSTNERMRSDRTGGKFQSTIMQEGANLDAMQKGNIPPDVLAQINRMVAENIGGGFNPTAPGFGNSAVANNAARNLGLTSLDIMRTGMSMAPAWRSNVDSFIYKPQNVMSDFIAPVAGMRMGGEQLQMQRDQAEYISANNIERADAMPDPMVSGQFRDSLLLGAVQNRADDNLNQSLLGLVNAGGAAYQSFKTSNSTPSTSPVPGVTNAAYKASTGMSPYRP